MAEPVKALLTDLATQLSEMAASVRRQVADLPPGGESAQAAPRPSPTLEQIAQDMLDKLHMRKRFLSPSLFHEPAWEILLSLFVIHASGRAVNVKHIVSIIDAPPTTSQRWIDQLVHMKLLARVVDPTDRRRLEISLTDAAARSVGDYLRWTVAQR